MKKKMCKLREVLSVKLEQKAGFVKNKENIHDPLKFLKKDNYHLSVVVFIEIGYETIVESQHVTPYERNVMTQITANDNVLFTFKPNP